MRLQLANPSTHPGVATLPFATALEEWDLPGLHGVLGLHRHVVRLIELGSVSYVVKELPDQLATREFRLLRELAEDGLPTVEAVAVVTDKPDRADGMLVTRHLDYSLPYRSLLSGRGLTIPYLGERVLDALVGLLVRLHLEGFYWGDCSLSNTLFRRDAGALSAYVIDLETGERYERLSAGQRRLDLHIATENVAGGLLDLQMGGRLAADIDPWDVGQAIEDRYNRLWEELTRPDEYDVDEPWRLQQRLERLHELGFDVEEMEVVATDDGARMRFVPRVVEHGYHTERLRTLTGLETEENQARRLLNDIRSYGAGLAQSSGRALPENIVAVRWLDQVFEPIIAAIPPDLFSKLEAAEIYHQLLEHRWFISQQRTAEVPIQEALESYIADVLAGAPDELVTLDPPTAELPITALDPAWAPDEPVDESDREPDDESADEPVDEPVDELWAATRPDPS